jgi:thiol-disulfide isomerase/thioredoxin
MVRIIDGEVVQDDDPRLKKTFKNPLEGMNMQKAGIVALMCYIAVLNVPDLIAHVSSGGGGGGGGGGASGGSGAVHAVKSIGELNKLIKFHKSKTGLPVVVDFFGESCGPCKMIAPVYAQFANQFKNKAVLLKVDIGAYHDVGAAFSVSSMPTFLFFLDGNMETRFSGADKNKLLKTITGLVAKSAKAGVAPPGLFLTDKNIKAYYSSKTWPAAGESATITSLVAESTIGNLLPTIRAMVKAHGVGPTLVSKDEANAKPLSPEEEAAAAEAAAAAAAKAAFAAKNEPPEVLLGSSTTQQLIKEMERRMGIDEDHAMANMANPIYSIPPNNGPNGQSSTYKVVIIGSGPAGLSAAVYAARAGLEPVVIAPAFGGQLMGKGVDVENYPGVVALAATGPKLVQLMQRQAFSFKTHFFDSWVNSVDVTTPGKFVLELKDPSTNELLQIEAATVIIATGADRYVDMTTHTHRTSPHFSATAAGLGSRASTI